MTENALHDRQWNPVVNDHGTRVVVAQPVRRSEMQHRDALGIPACDGWSDLPHSLLDEAIQTGFAKPFSPVFVNVVVASLHAHCFNSVRGVRSGLSQTSSFNSQLRVERDHR